MTITNVNNVTVLNTVTDNITHELPLGCQAMFQFAHAATRQNFVLRFEVFLVRTAWQSNAGCMVLTTDTPYDATIVGVRGSAV